MGILQDNPILTDRELAAKLELSFFEGLNYSLRALIDNGFVKMKNFKSWQKLKFVYLLTPKVIKEKSSLTYRLLERKLQEYELLKSEIDALKGQVDHLVLESHPPRKATIYSKLNLNLIWEK